tara:strand:+ start:30 stop:812 length:783 start_codon:yes stop_codon:yes gene_type:complete
MKAKIHKNNPFPPKVPHSLVWQYLHDNQISGDFLDYGAHDGRILKILSKDGFVETGIGLDANKDVVEKNQSILPENLKLKLIHKNSPLDFADNTFDIVIILGVIEHVNDQKKLLDELYRVLKPGGKIVALVPGKSFFSFLDLGNWKYVFPRLHKFFYTLAYSKREYEKRYVDCENGLFGDIEVEKGWHQHFSSNELKQLMEESDFVFSYIDGRGLFYRLIIIFNLSTFKIFNFLFSPLLNLDSKIFSQDEIMISCSKPKN